jgi:hypothetical protein
LERVSFLQSKIEQVMNLYLAHLRQPSNEKIHFESIIDNTGLHYQIIAVGWENEKRIFNLLFHLDIIDEKIWVQEDKMENSIAEMLVEYGISKKDIVLAYFPEYHRQFTEYAVA